MALGVERRSTAWSAFQTATRPAVATAIVTRSRGPTMTGRLTSLAKNSGRAVKALNEALRAELDL